MLAKLYYSIYKKHLQESYITNKLTVLFMYHKQLMKKILYTATNMTTQLETPDFKQAHKW